MSVHPAVTRFSEALERLSDAAPDLTLEDTAVLSECQVRLAVIVLQTTETEKVRWDMEGGLP